MMKLKNVSMAMVMAGLALAAQACSSDSGGGLGGAGGGIGGAGTGGAGGSSCPVGAGITYDAAGTAHDYVITAVVPGTDGCGLGVADFVDAVIPVRYKVATGVNDLGVGNTSGNPEEPSLGHGAVDGTTCTGTLVRNTQVTPVAGSGCDLNDKVTSKVSIIGSDIFTLDVEETWSAFTDACGSLDANDPDQAPVKAAAAAGTCTSTFKVTLKRVAGGAGGAGGGGGGGGAGGSKS